MLLLIHPYVFIKVPVCFYESTRMFFIGYPYVFKKGNYLMRIYFSFLVIIYILPH